MRLHLHATRTPDKPALIMDDGIVLSFAELDLRSARAATALREAGVAPGDAVAILSSNDPGFLVAAWASHRVGARYTPVSTYLTAGEIEYVLQDCGAELLLVSPDLSSLAVEIADRLPALPILSTGDETAGFASLPATAAKLAAQPPHTIVNGAPMVYSAGTTGRPKGIRRPLGGLPIDQPFQIAPLMAMLFGLDASGIYLSPAPLYHAAPLGYSMAAQDLGATVVLMRRFDAERALQLIATHRVTHAQFVPTQFIRMLALPEAIRSAADLSSLQRAFHAAAPCPVAVKQAMLDWWGMRIHEYYAGSEGVGMTSIAPGEWLEHRGSVGRALGCEVAVFGDDDRELPAGEIGTIAFRGGEPLSYHNDPAKSAAARNRHGFASYGDVGWLDADGYLYLSDRKNFTIVSGGVNIYPAEIEQCLLDHPDVGDVAVFGGPDADMGEQVIAVVEPRPGVPADDALRAALLAFARTRLSRVKLPRRIDFTTSLPREENGKLYKTALRDTYWVQPNADRTGPASPGQPG